MATHNEGVSLQGNFHEFFEKWTVEQSQYLRELVSATKTPTTTPLDSSVSGLVHRVIGHYEEYYKVKSYWVQADVFTMLAPPWRTDLEDSFQWIGGWRPSMAFHLLYSKVGLQLEVVLEQVWSEQGSSSPADDMAGLGPILLSLVDQLQKKTIEQERQITEEMARHQETVADMDMVELSHEVTELMGEANGTGKDEHEVERVDKRLETIIMPKEEGLKRIVRGADDLRLRTLKGVTEILSPNQALHFLIAAAELHLRLHDWGKQLYDKKHSNGVAQSH